MEYIGPALTGTLTNGVTALVDPFGGLAGDMLLGALLDIDDGLEAALREPLSSLDLPGWSLEVEATTRRQLGCTKVSFRVPDERDHRHLPEIRERIERSSLAPRAKRKADETFVALAEAEARVHRIPVERVHFHEVGAADAILDICAVSAALDRLGVDELVCGPLPGGSGTVRCAHGDMPCPAPAVTELLADFVVVAGAGEGEMVTPTGAALLRAWGRPLDDAGLAHRTRATGYGAGTRSTSIVRVSLIEILSRSLSEAPAGAPTQAVAAELARDAVYVLETNLDDESPEILGWLANRLFGLGALDVAFVPLTMKKGRPGVALTAQVPPAVRELAVRTILRETSALGVREQLVHRTILRREMSSVDTPWGPVGIKRAGGRARLEYEDLARIARAEDLALREVRAMVEGLLDGEDDEEDAG